jgi:filamentous hemagglutinin family protein
MEGNLPKAGSLNAKRFWRAALFASTALSAVMAVPAARAQTTVAPGATPQGGVVVGGASTIVQAPGSTTINQTSERAAIDWQSFDVGANAKVQFNQPDANAISLNRVVGGDLSRINGQISANGQLVLINQSGVVFGQGAQVNAENIVVSTANIVTEDFMAGKMVFSGAPRPGAKIVNDGNITVKDTGLVGLIAPQVENNGVIVARLGQVVLAGASAFTLDLYGDRLISLDVTKAVQAVDVGGKPVAALVTNRGLILADGGKITLTAQDADALVTQLIDAGGTIRADSVGGQAGAIAIQGVGGNISIAGNLLARGTVAGATGGTVEALASGTVAVAPTAVIDASGDAGGGVVAIGTDILRARQGAADATAPKAAAVRVAAGARIAADATGFGNAGTVALLSAQRTDFQGTVSLRGGPLGGDGGLAEISSDGVISLGGTVLASAINGRPGEILLDPQTLVVSGAATTTTIANEGNSTTLVGGDTATSSNILNTQLDALVGTIVLEAASLISVTAPVNMTTAGTVLVLSSGGSVSVSASIDVNGSLDIDAGGSLFVGGGLTASNMLLTSGTAGTDLNAGVTAVSGTVKLSSTGTIFEGSSGLIDAAVLASGGSIGGGATLAGNNTIGTLGGFTLGGNLTLADSGGLTVGGSVSGANVSLSAASITFESGLKATGLLQLASTGTIFQGAGTIAAGTLAGGGSTGVTLDNANAIGTLAGFTVSSGGLALVDAGSLNITGSVAASSVYLSATTLSLGADVAATASSQPTLALAVDRLVVGAGSFAAAGGTIEIAPHSAGFGVDLAGSAASALDLPATLADAFAAPNILIGRAFGSVASSIAIDGGMTFGASALDLSTAGTILDNAGTLSAAAVKFAGAGLTQNSAAAFSAGVFGGDGGAISGNVLLAGTANAIGTLAGFTAGGMISLLDAGSLNMTGTLAGSDVFLVAPTLALASAATLQAGAGGTLALAGDAISLGGADKLLAGGGTIEIAPLTASTVIDIGGASAPGTLGLAGSLAGAFDTNASRIIIGDAAVGTQASGIRIDAPLNFGTSALVDLSTSGTIFDNSGNLTAGSLVFGAPGGFTQSSTAGIIAGLFGGDGSGAASVLLPGPNTIGSLGSFALSAGSTLTLIDAGTLTIAGAIDPAAVTLYGAAGLVIGTNVSATLLALGSGGTITQTGGSITAGTLISDGSIGGGAYLTQAANSIGTLGAFTLGGTLDLVDTGLLEVAGSVGGAVITLAAGSLGFAGVVNAGTLLALASGGTISQSGGSIVAPTLVGIGVIGGDVALGSATNAIGTLGGLTLGGGLALADGAALDIAGIVTAAGNITLSGTSLTEEITGGLRAGTVGTGAGSFSGGVQLASTLNSIAALGDFTLAGNPGANNFTLDNGGSLDIVGLLSTPGGVKFYGGGVSETGAGAIDASSLETGTNTIAGDVLLGGANTIGLVGPFNATGTFALADSGTLALGQSITGADIYLSAPTLNIQGFPLTDIIAGSNAAPGTLALAANDIITGSHPFTLAAPGGTIEVAPLGAGTAVDLGGTASSAGTLALAGSLVAGFGASAAAVVIGGGAIGAPARAIDIDNSVSFGGAGIVDLVTSGLISDFGTLRAPTLEFHSAGFAEAATAAVDAGTLQGDGTAVTGSVFLTGTANSIAVLNGISLSSGTLSVIDTGTLTIAGAIDPDAVTLYGAAGLLIGADVTAGTLVALGSGGTITQTGGGIDAPTLSSFGSIGGGATLSGSTNTIATLGGFTLGGNLALNDQRALDLAGALATPGTVSLSGTALSESAGVIDAAGFGGSLSGGASLGGANSIAALAGLTLGGNLTLADAIGLDIAGPVATPGAIVLSGTSLSESAGTIVAGTLATGAGSFSGTAVLGHANTIGALGAFDAVGGFTLSDAAPTLAIAGLVQSAGTINLAGGTIAETTGAITAARLTGTASGAGLFANANSIATLGSFFAGGDFYLADTGSLSIVGHVAAADVGLAAQTLGLSAAVDSTLAGGTLALAFDAITVSSGTFGANAGTVALAPFTSGHGIDLGGTSANALELTGNIGTLFGGSAVEYVLGSALGSHAGFIDIDGSVSFATGVVDLVTAGAIADNAGTLSAATLEFDAAGFTQASGAAIAAATLQGDGGTIGGSVVLAGTANAIGTLGGMSLAAGTLALTDGRTLVVAGVVSAPDIYLTDSNAGGVSVAGSLLAGSGGTIGLVADAAAGVAGGTIAAPGGLVRIAPFSASVIDLGGSSFGGLEVSEGLIQLVGANTLQVGTGAGTIRQEGDVSIAAATLVLDGGSIDFGGSLAAPALVRFASVGDVSEGAAGTLNAPLVGGTAGGTIGLVGANAIGTLGAVSAGGNITLNNGASLLLAGLAQTGGRITLDDAAGVTEVSGGLLAAGTLTTGAGSIGGDAYLTNGNSIGLLTGFTVAGDLRFADAGGAGALTLGSVNAGDASFGAAGIVVAGLLNIGPANGTLGLFSSGGISETSSGVIAAKTLTGSDIGGDVTLLQGNSIGVLGDFAAGGNHISLRDASALDIAGLVGAGSIALSGTSLTESTGTLAAAVLSGGFTGNVSLGGANTVSTLGGFTLAAGSLTLNDTGLLTVGGPVVAPFATITAAGMSITGAISAASVLALGGTGDIVESGTGGIAAGTLVSVGMLPINGNVLLTDTLNNAVATLGGFTIGSADTLVLDDAGLLTVAGPVNAMNATFYAGTLAIAGALSGDSQTLSGGNIIIEAPVSVASLLALESAGDISETGAGTITAPTLTSGGTSIGGFVSLTSAANAIGTLGGFTLGGALDLVDGGSLDVAGTVLGPMVSLTADTINFSGIVDATQALALGGTLVTQSGGGITTPSLVSIGSIVGGVTLGSAGNAISTLGGFTLGGTLDLLDSGQLTVAGPVAGPVVSLSAGSLALAGVVNAGSLLALGATGGISQGGGSIAAPTLVSIGLVGGDTALGGTPNDIGTLGGFAAGGTLALADAVLLTIDGPVSAADAFFSAPGIAVDGAVTAAGPGTIGLFSTAGVTEAGGLLSAGTLTGTVSGGDVALGDVNAIGTLGGFTLAGSHTLTFDNGTLAVLGPVIAPVATISAAGLSIAGTISASTRLALESTAGIVESAAGRIGTALLTSGGSTIAGGPVALAGTANLIGTLGNFAAFGDVALSDAQFLNVAGPVGAADVDLTAPGIGIFGALGATGTAGLASTGGVTETGAGVITAGTLTGTDSGGDVALLTGNSIGTLGNFAVTGGNFSLNDATALDIAGLVGVGAAQTITLEGAGPITEGTGTLAAGVLNSGGTAIGGDVALTNSLNNILTLAGFTVAAGHTLTLADATLAVGGPVVAPFVTLSAGGISISGAINAASLLALESTAGVSESAGGVLATPSLTSGGTSITGTVVLAGTQNAIGTLGGFTAGALALNDAGLLTVAGPVTAAFATLAATSIGISGLIDAATQLALQASGGVGEAASGGIAAGTLTSGGFADGNVSLGSALNTIATLGSFTAAGLTLLDSGSNLTIAAPVSVTGLLALNDPGSISQAGGRISAATLTSNAGAASFGAAGNAIAVLGGSTIAGALALSDASALALNGNIFTGTSLTLADAGQSITQTGGTVGAGVLNVTAANVTLARGNAIASLGSVNAGNAYLNGVDAIGGPVSIGNAGTIIAPVSLPVTGSVNAGTLVLQTAGNFSGTGSMTGGNLTVAAAGDIQLAGYTSIANNLDLMAGGNIGQTSGTLYAGTLSGSVGTIAGAVAGGGTLANFGFTGGTTDIGTIGNFIMADSLFELNNAGPLTLLGSLVANIVSITTNGALLLQGTPNGAGGGLYIESAVVTPPYFVPKATDSVIRVNNGSLSQTNTFNINTGNGPGANLFLYVAAGSVNFSQSGLLYAPAVNLEVEDTNGTVNGNVNLARVVILTAATNSVDLTGTLAGLTGQAAASKGIVDPFPKPDFRFNACPIGSVNCTILPIETLPPGNPLQNFDISQRKRKKLDKSIQLPGVATRDF